MTKLKSRRQAPHGFYRKGNLPDKVVYFNYGPENWSFSGKIGPSELKGPVAVGKLKVDTYFMCACCSD
jgi:hypothetical protein